jgi:hypothetical protein
MYYTLSRRPYGASVEVLHGLLEHGSQPCCSSQHLEAYGGVVALEISWPDRIIRRI